MVFHKPPHRTTSAQQTLAVLLLIPLLSLAGLWGFTASITLSNVDNNQRSNTVITTIAPSVIGMAQTFAAERGLTLAWLSTNRDSAPLRTQMLAARRATDAVVASAGPAMASVRGLLSQSGKAQLSGLNTDLNRRAAIRAAVDKGADSSQAAFTAYGVIDSTLYNLAGNATSPADPTFSLMLQASIAEVQGADFIAAASGLIEGVLAAGGTMSAAERVLLGEIVSGQNLEVGQSLALSTPEVAPLISQVFDSAAYRSLATTENRILSGPPGRSVGVTPKAFQSTTQALQTVQGSVLPKLAVVVGAKAAQLHNSLLNELYLAAGLGLLAVIASLLVAVRLGRRFRRELADLYDSARQMAEERLPRLTERLRRGEDVDVAEESPPLQQGRITETASVARAFSTVQRTAVEAAVGQANLRKGVSQVFVSLSLRSQSLLYRQLSMLDDMERATSDPTVLSDLFRLDHLTTRMRRHAEGLLILAGSTPGRGWREPVLLEEVLSAAIAEVEDYLRVNVVRGFPDAVLGIAVNDVIHLLAELIENATTFSPPSTRVEIRSEIVGHGLAVEIEDRGLSMPAEVMAAFNARLADPPEFDLANSDQLGLFVAARLAQRHQIKISLRESPFKGTTAIVVLPLTIIVPVQDDERTHGATSAGELLSSVLAYGPGQNGVKGHGGVNGDSPSFGFVGRHHRLGAVQGSSPVTGSAPVPEASRLDMPARPARAAPAQLPTAGEQPSQPQPGNGPAGGSPEPGVIQLANVVAADGSRAGLPRRTRGTSLAPALRQGSSAALGDQEGPQSPSPALSPGAFTRSAEEAGSLLSTLQDGWERARIENFDYFEEEGQS